MRLVIPGHHLVVGLGVSQPAVSAESPAEGALLVVDDDAVVDAARDLLDVHAQHGDGGLRLGVLLHVQHHLYQN